MNQIAEDREVQHLMREFVMCCNRVDNIEARESDYATLSAMREQRRNAAKAIEEAFLARGWVPPLGSMAVRIPETANR